MSAKRRKEEGERLKATGQDCECEDLGAEAAAAAAGRLIRVDCLCDQSVC